MNNEPPDKTTESGPGQGLDLSNGLELVTKIGASLLALTYVSGYLIVNTYMSSFGINDSADLFKAKYIYVGFLYLLFMSVVILLFAVVKKVWDLKEMLFPRAISKGVSEADKKHVTQNAQSDSDTLKQIETNRRLVAKSFLVWVLVVAAFEIPIALQITLLHSQNFKDYMIAQLALLFCVFLYQLTYYRIYHDFEWDKGSRVILWIRILCLVLELCFASAMLKKDWLRSAAAWYGSHGRLQYGLTAALVVLLAWLFRPLLLSGHELRAWERQRRPVFRWIAGPFVAGVVPLKRLLSWRLLIKRPNQTWRLLVFGGFLLTIPFITSTARPYSWRWSLIQNGVLFMAITVLGGVVVLSIQANQRREAERHVHDTSTTERWVRWILRVTVVVTLYLASTLGYSFAVYNHIPVQKEGGDFTTASIVRITVERKDNCQQPDSCSEVYEDMVILSQDSTFIYAAKVDDWETPAYMSTVKSARLNCQAQYLCGPKHWRDGILEPCGPFRPHLYAISQRTITKIQDLGTVNEYKKCADLLPQ
jgi:hypothetical protein